MFQREQFWKNFQSVFLKILKMPYFKIFKNLDGDVPQKSPRPNARLLVNHTKPTSTFY